MRKAVQDGVCFVAGTMVLTNLGNIAIETVRAGDRVWAENPETGEKALKSVVQTFINQTDELVRVFAGGDEIVATSEHPFYVEGEGWTASKQLRAGSLLIMQDGSRVPVMNVRHETLEKPETVYNFEVEDFHTYFVGKDSVLVHNLSRLLKAGDTTPKGYVLTKHAAEHANERGFTLIKIDEAISSYSHKFYSYGEEIFCKKNGNYYDLVIKSRSNNNIVSVIGGESKTLKTTKDIEKFFKNQDKYISTVPIN